MMFKKDKKIANQKAMIENRDKLIKDLQTRIDMLKRTNTDFRCENEEQQELLRTIADLSVTYPLGSEKIVLGKIKELARDYQSKD